MVLPVQPGDPSALASHDLRCRWGWRTQRLKAASSFDRAWSRQTVIMARRFSRADQARSASRPARATDQPAFGRPVLSRPSRARLACSRRDPARRSRAVCSDEDPVGHGCFFSAERIAASGERNWLPLSSGPRSCRCDRPAGSTGGRRLKAASSFDRARSRQTVIMARRFSRADQARSASHPARA